MNITIIGTDYVDLVTGTYFLEMGSKVTYVDIADSLLKAIYYFKGII